MAFEAVQASSPGKAEETGQDHIQGGGSGPEVLPASPSQVPNSEKRQHVETQDGEATQGGPTEAPAKRTRTNPPDDSPVNGANGKVLLRQRGVAHIKAEFLLHPELAAPSSTVAADDDAAEASHHRPNRDHPSKGQAESKNRGQNKGRSFGSSKDKLELCGSRSNSAEFSPQNCQYGDGCRFEHDLRRYLREGRRADLTSFGGLCPTWDAQGVCDFGWKCRFLGSHMREVVRDDGREELVLVVDESRKLQSVQSVGTTASTKIVNVVELQHKKDLMRKAFKTEKADLYSEWLEKVSKEIDGRIRSRKPQPVPASEADVAVAGELDSEDRQDQSANYTEAPLRPSEKRRIYFGAETPVLAPLTTQGNLPFRRLCVDLGAQLTYSEMAMSLPLIQGAKSEWALMRAHTSETTPPRSGGEEVVVPGYEAAKDLKFGAQIAGSKPWQVLKATEVLTGLCPHLRVIDLNCGCPIDLVYRAGAGSALLDNPAKLEKMLRGMNVVSGEVPVTVKIRMGTKTDRPNASKLAERLVLGGYEAHEAGQGPAGVAAITLHGRSRQQRYTKQADWAYIADCAALIQRLQERADRLTDTTQEAEARDLPASPGGKVYFLGNGDCYSHVDYQNHLKDARVDSVMVARGALIKPWIFEEIEHNQYLDKSASERLGYVERFAKYGLQTWGSDERGVGTTRRFLLEWLSFAYRYVPLGILEYLPPNLQDRPPAWRGRSDLETLLGSGNYKDWIKISEMFLGPAHQDFKFEPKHRSNSYEIQAEG